MRSDDSGLVLETYCFQYSRSAFLLCLLGKTFVNFRRFLVCFTSQSHQSEALDLVWIIRVKMSRDCSTSGMTEKTRRWNLQHREEAMQITTQIINRPLARRTV